MLYERGRETVWARNWYQEWGVIVMDLATLFWEGMWWHLELQARKDTEHSE